MSAPRLVDTVGEGEDVANWESTIETYTLTFVKQIAGGDLLGNKGSSNQGLCDNLEEWVGMGDGKEVQEGGDICISVADSCWCMEETNTLL